jgi:hypothetical protein
MRPVSMPLFVALVVAGCSSVNSNSGSPLHQQAQSAMVAVPNDKLPPRPMGRPLAIKDVQPGQYVTILQYVDATETWVTGQVESVTAEKVTLVRCEVEERKPGKSQTAVNRTRASRYTLPPGEIRAVRAA